MMVVSVGMAETRLRAGERSGAAEKVAETSVGDGKGRGRGRGRGGRGG